MSNVLIATPSGSRDDLVATPTLQDGGFLGDRLDVLNRGSTELVFFSNTSLPGSKLHMKSERVTLEPNDAIQFVWDGSGWYETSRAFVPDGRIDARDYGLLESATGAANATALTAAVVAAIATGKELWLPAGDFDIDVNNTAVTGAVPVNGSTTLRGAGRGLTTLTATNFDPATGAAMFKLSAGLNTINMSSMKLVGPPASSMTDDFTTSWAAWMGGGQTVRYTDIEFRQWAQPTKVSPEYPSYPGRGSRVYYTDCRFDYFATGPLHVEGDDRDWDVCEFSRCEWEWDSTFASVPKNAGSNGQYHAIYVGTGVSLAVDNCRFLSTGGHGAGDAGYAFLHYGGSGTPRYARCTNTYFAQGVRSSMLTASTAQTSVTGCTFALAGYGIRPKGDLSLSACSFTAYATSIYAVIDDQSSDVAILATACSFTAAAGGGFVYAVRRTVSSSSKLWRFVGCRFGDVMSAGFCVGVDTGVVLLDDCEFGATVGTYSVALTGGTAIISDSRVTGTKPFYVDVATAASTLDLRRNTWAQSAATEVNINAARALTIRGTDNLLYETAAGKAQGFALVGGAANVAQLSGQFQCSRGVGNYDYSAGVLTVNVNYDCFSVDVGGGPTIATINFSGSIAAGFVSGDLNRLMTATIRLHVKQAFTLSAAGNIVAAGGARTVDSIVTLQYLPSPLGKWYEV